MIDIREGEPLDMLKLGSPEVLCKAGGSPRAADRAAQAEQKSCRCRKEHETAHPGDVSHISGVDAFVYDRRH